MPALSHAFAVGRHAGPDAGLDAVATLEVDPQLARLAANEPEQRYLLT